MDNQNFPKVERKRGKPTTKRKKPLEQEVLLGGREGAAGNKQSDLVGIKSESDAVEDWKPEMWQRNGHVDASAGPEFNTSNNEISSVVPLSKGSSSDNSMGPLSQSNTMPGMDSSSNELSNLGGGGGIKTPGSLPPTPSSQQSSQATSQPNSQSQTGSSQQMSANCIRPVSNVAPNGPMSRMLGRPQSTGIPEGLVNGPGGHFMSQQSQIFVFSTNLANEAAEVVQRGQCRSIVDFHLDHPATRQFLQNFPLGNNNFGRPQSMPLYPDGAMGKFTSKDQMQFNEGSALANVELWVQQQNASLQEGPFSPSFGPSGSSKQSRSGRNGNSGSQRWLPSPNNWMPNNPSAMVGEFAPDHHMQIPGGYLGDPQMPPGRGGAMPGPNNLDENLTPEQLQKREEQLAQIQKIRHMLFPEKRNEFGNRPLPVMYGPGPPRPGPEGMMSMMRFPPHHPANMMPPPGYFNDMPPQPRMSGPHSPVSPSFGMNRDPSGFFFQGAPPPGMNFPQNGPHPSEFHPDFMPEGMSDGMFFGPNGPVGPRMHHGPHEPMPGGPMGPFGPTAARFPGMCKPKRRRNAAGDKSEDIYRHLQPAPSPQQFCSLNLFEGQELTITRQINLAYQDAPEDRSPSQPPFNVNAGGGPQQAKKKKKVDNSTRSNEDSKMSVKSEIPCTPDLFGGSSLQSPMPTPNMNSSAAPAATPQLPQLVPGADASANPETPPANAGSTESKQPNVSSLPHCSAQAASKSGSNSGVMSNITSPTLASLAKGVESMSDRMEQDMLQGGLFRTVQMPENDPDVSDEILPAPSQAGSRMRPNETSEPSAGDSTKLAMSEAIAAQNPDFENDKVMMMMKPEAPHHLDGPSSMGMDRRSPPNHMFPEVKGHQGMLGNADVRIQARAPNTIQYMPARPPNENSDAMPRPMLPSGFNGPEFNGPMMGPDGNPMFDTGPMGASGFDGGPIVPGDMLPMGSAYGNPMHRSFNGPNMGSFGNGQGGPMPGFDPQAGPMFEGPLPPGMAGPMMPGFNGPPPPGYNGQGHFVNGPGGPMHPGCMPGFEGPCGPMPDFDGPQMPGGPQMPAYANFGPRPMIGGFHGGGPMGMHNPEMYGGRMPTIHGDVKPNEPMRTKGEGTTKKEKDKKKRSESNKKGAASAANQPNMNLTNDKNGMNVGRGGSGKMRPEMMMRMGGGGPEFMGMAAMDGKIRHELMSMGGGPMLEPGMVLRPNMMGGPPDGRIRPGMIRMSDEGAFMGMMDGPMMRMSRESFMMSGVAGEGPKKADGPARPGSGMMMMENPGENGMRPVSRSHSDKGMMGQGDGGMRPGSAMIMGLPPEMGGWPGSMMGPPGERVFMSGMDGMRPDSRLSAMGIGPEGTPVRPTSASIMGIDPDMNMMMSLSDGIPRPGSGMMSDGGIMSGSNAGDMPMKGGPDGVAMQMRQNEANAIRMSGGPEMMMGMPGMTHEGMMMINRGGMTRMMMDMGDPRMVSEMEGMVCRNGPMSHRMDPGMPMMDIANGNMFPGHMMSGPDRRMMMDPDQFGNGMPFEMMRAGPNFNSHGGGLISGDPAIGMGR